MSLRSGRLGNGPPSRVSPAALALRAQPGPLPSQALRHAGAAGGVLASSQVGGQPVGQYEVGVIAVVE